MTVKRHHPKCDCRTCKPVKIDDYVEFWMDCGDSESGPRPPTCVAVRVEDADETHVLIESPWDGEPVLMRRDVVTVVPRERLNLEDGEGPNEEWFGL